MSEYLNNKVFEATIIKFKKSKQDKIRYEFIIEDLTSSNEKRVASGKKISHDLLSFVEQYKIVSNEFETSQNELAAQFYLLAKNICIYTSEINESELDSMQGMVITCFEKIDKFSAGKGKAFNYFSTISINHARQEYRSVKSYKLFKERYKDYMSAKHGTTTIKNGKEISYDNNQNDC